MSSHLPDLGLNS